MEIESLKKQILNSCKKLDQRHLVANHDGNISVRLNSSQCLATPTAFAKTEIKESDLLTIQLDGKVLAGPHKIFSEWVWHQAIYTECPEVTSVVHAHPPHLMALVAAGEMFDVPMVPEAVVSLGAPIHTTPLILTAKPELSDIQNHVREGLNTSYVFAVPGNGAFAVGDDPEMAYLRMELLEHISKIYYLTRQLGSTKRLPGSFVQELNSRRPPLKPKWAKTEVTPIAQVTSAPTTSSSSDQFLIETVKKLVLEQLSK